MGTTTVGRVFRPGNLRPGVDRMLPQHIEHLGHADKHGYPARPDQADDIVRVEAAREDDGSSQHRRHIGGHGLAEHVAEGQKIKEPQRMKRPRVLAIFQDFALHRDDVRQHVAMPDDDALGIRGRA